MAFREPWMDLGLCGMFPELPWIKEPEVATKQEVADMLTTCRVCGVLGICRGFAEREGISSGFWAGEFRDLHSDSVDGAA